jgi:hypothetical protein
MHAFMSTAAYKLSLGGVTYVEMSGNEQLRDGSLADRITFCESMCRGQSELNATSHVIGQPTIPIDSSRSVRQYSFKCT